MATVHKRRKRRGAEGWQKILGRFKDSGLNVEAFCRAESISTASYYRWRQRLGENEKQALATDQTPFIELGPLGGNTAWDIELELGDGLVLRLRRN